MYMCKHELRYKGANDNCVAPGHSGIEPATLINPLNKEKCLVFIELLHTLDPRLVVAIDA